MNFVSLRKSDPTRTAILRRNFVIEMSRRYSALMSVSKNSILDNDCFGLMGSGIGFAYPEVSDSWKNNIVPIDEYKFAFLQDKDKVNGFIDWFREMELQALFQRVYNRGTTTASIWINIYLRYAYIHGIKWARYQLKADKKSFSILKIPPSSLNTSAMDIEVAIANKTHLDKINLLYTRSFIDLQGIVAATDVQLSRVLAEGIGFGFAPNKIAKEIVSKISTIGKHRAILLARTEVIRAHHVASIEEYRRFGVGKVKITAEWTTAGDSRVCQRCKDIDYKVTGKLWDLDEIEPLIPLHPQCRCAAVPHIE